MKTLIRVIFIYSIISTLITIYLLSHFILKLINNEATLTHCIIFIVINVINFLLSIHNTEKSYRILKEEY